MWTKPIRVGLCLGLAASSFSAAGCNLFVLAGHNLAYEVHRAAEDKREGQYAKLCQAPWLDEAPEGPGPAACPPPHLVAPPPLGDKGTYYGKLAYPAGPTVPATAKPTVQPARPSEHARETRDVPERDAGPPPERKPAVIGRKPPVAEETPRADADPVPRPQRSVIITGVNGRPGMPEPESPPASDERPDPEPPARGNQPDGPPRAPEPDRLPDPDPTP